MDNLSTIFYAMYCGFRDSLKGTLAIFYLDKNIKERATRTSPNKDHSTPSRRRDLHQESRRSSKEEEPKILKRTLQCCALNGGVFWLSLIIFDSGLLPFLKYLLTFVFGQSNTGQNVWFWMHFFLSWTFGAFWVLPLFLLSRIVNSLWFQDIADSAYRYSRGRPQLLSSVSKLIADTLFSILVQALFLVQSNIVCLVPIQFVGFILHHTHVCMLYALYSFEYKWFNMGWELHKRLTFIENNWPYFIGFGMPLAILTAIPGSFFNSGCVFSILFPLFIISGNEAEPVTGACDYPLQLFSPVIAISNALFNRTIKPASVRR
ncbi:Etoposide-induced protein 2.4 [Blattella germanica]|nr:Etoposide-induced protein 2.4 [Blattella germanica]